MRCGMVRRTAASLPAALVEAQLSIEANLASVLWVVDWVEE